MERGECANLADPLAIANHFVTYSKQQVDKESGEQPTPGARGMTS